MNFVFAVVIGLVVGGVVGFILRGKDASALWLAPVLGVVGAVVASVLATLFGDPGYGWKEATLQVVLAAVGAGAVWVLANRKTTTTTTAATP
jgi:uncharacterized membrane protein YeaQ/YmgE (transglycosylase-associated protein family)